MILRLSGYLSQIFIFFISLSLFTILYAGMFLPSTTSLLSSSNENNFISYHKVSYLYSNSYKSYFYNYGDSSIKIARIYIDPLDYYNGSIYIIIDDNWIRSDTIPPHTIFALDIGDDTVSKIDSLIFFTDTEVIRVYV